MALEDESEDVGTRYYGTSINDQMNYGYGSSGYGFDSNTYLPQTVTSAGFGDSYDFWADIGINPATTGEGGSFTPDSSWDGSADVVGSLKEIANAAGKEGFNRLKQAFTKKDKEGNTTVDWAALATAGIGLYSLANKDKAGGYNKPVPKMDMTRQQVPYAQDPNRRPGEGGRRYFTDTQYTPQGDAGALAAAQTAATTQGQGIMAAAPQYAAPPPNPYAGKIPTSFSQQRQMPAPAEGAGLPQIPTQLNAQGTINMAEGGIADAGRYLQGKTDGMADKIPSSIDGEQPAALSHGEFVIPADVVSHLGNGNSDAGAQKLYEMMDRIRQARTGTTEQGKEINPDEFTMGGLAAAYAGGGEVQRFNNGGGPVTPAPAQTGAGIPQDVSRTSTLSPWVGDYVTNALGQGAALAQAPYQAYQGPLTAGPADLQQQAFAGASDIASAGYTPGQFAGGFGANQAAQYMNPYIQASLNPQLAELQRQSEIARMTDAGRLTKAGAYGGSRQAIMESEGRRNLLDKQAGLIGSGYKSAYDTGLGQFNREREAEEASRQFGANFGMKTVDQLANLGNVQRGITSEGLAADKAQFEEERNFAYEMPKYQLGLLSGIATGANTTSVDQDAISKLKGDIAGLGAIYQQLSNLGQTPATPAAPVK